MDGRRYGERQLVRVVAIEDVAVDGLAAADVIALRTSAYLRPLAAYLGAMDFKWRRAVHRVGAFDSYVRVVHPQEDRAGVRAGVRAVAALLDGNHLAVEVDVGELA